MSQPATYAVPARDAGDGAGQAVLSGALGLLITGLVVALRLVPTDELVGHFWLIRIWSYAAFGVFALTVAIRGRTIWRRLAAFVLAAGFIALDYWWQSDLVLDVYREVDPDSAIGRWVWVLPSAAVVLALCLAWGFARRRGVLWPFGALLAAGALAVVLHEDVLVDRLPAPDTTAGEVANALVIPAAIWLGCLISWALDKATVRDRSEGRIYPAIGHTDSPYQSS